MLWVNNVVLCFLKLLYFGCKYSEFTENYQIISAICKKKTPAVGQVFLSKESFSFTLFCLRSLGV